MWCFDTLGGWQNGLETRGNEFENDGIWSFLGGSRPMMEAARTWRCLAIAGAKADGQLSQKCDVSNCDPCQQSHVIYPLPDNRSPRLLHLAPVAWSYSPLCYWQLVTSLVTLTSRLY
jgi:hypothetical protein